MDERPYYSVCLSVILIPYSKLNKVYTECIKMIEAVLKLIIFTSMVNRIINTVEMKE